MRVAVVSDMIRPNGAGVMALLAATVLTDLGHEVLVIGGAIDAELERRLSSTHDRARSFTHDERALDGSVTPTDHVAFRRSFMTWLDAELASFDPDIVYVHNCGRVLDQLDLADLSHRVPVVHTMHDEWFTTDAHYTYRPDRTSAVVRTFEPGRSEHVLEHRYDHLFEIPARIGRFALIAPSAWLAERARRVFPAIDVHHVPNAVDTKLFDLQDRASSRAALGLPIDREIVLFVGSPTQERKGFRAFEEAVRHASNDGRGPIRLVIGGSASMITDGLQRSLTPGPIFDNLHEPNSLPLGPLGIMGDAIVISGIDRSLIPAVYGAADLLVHPSVIDNLPTVPIEAGLCGTRCLATNVGGTRETIADLDDLVDANSSPQELGARIRNALDEGSSESIESRQARRDAQLERFSIELHRTRLLPILESMTGAS